MSQENVSFTKIKPTSFETPQQGKRLQKTTLVSLRLTKAAAQAAGISCPRRFINHDLHVKAAVSKISGTTDVGPFLFFVLLLAFNTFHSYDGSNNIQGSSVLQVQQKM